MRRENPKLWLVAGSAAVALLLSAYWWRGIFWLWWTCAFLIGAAMTVAPVISVRGGQRLKWTPAIEISTSGAFLTAAAQVYAAASLAVRAFYPDWKAGYWLFAGVLAFLPLILFVRRRDISRYEREHFTNTV